MFVPWTGNEPTAHHVLRHLQSMFFMNYNKMYKNTMGLRGQDFIDKLRADNINLSRIYISIFFVG